MKIAVVGTGISGLSAAWALAPDHDVTVYEARERLGGHANTVDVASEHGVTAVDTGFIVYNERTYPHLTRLFAALDVPTAESDMSFAFSVDRHLEYGGSLRGLLARPASLLSRRYRRMVTDILRFRRDGDRLIREAGSRTVTDLLADEGYGEGFVDDYLLPMAAAIWSSRPGDILGFPASSFLAFFRNHGLIDFTDRPQWRTVVGGSREYVDRIALSTGADFRLSSPVERIVRSASGAEILTATGSDVFDQVVLATHSDQALRLLGDDATHDERRILGALPYTMNRAVLHTDDQLMPRRRSVWSSWNYVTGSEGHRTRQASVTYWMNRLQNLDTEGQIFVSLNPLIEPDPAKTLGSFDYAHPLFDAAAVAAQARSGEIQGVRRTWFAGAYLGYGFHEDGAQSGFNVAAALGSPAPWHDDIVPVSPVPAVPAPVRHHIAAPGVLR